MLRIQGFRFREVYNDLSSFGGPRKSRGVGFRSLPNRAHVTVVDLGTDRFALGNVARNKWSPLSSREPSNRTPMRVFSTP